MDKASGNLDVPEGFTPWEYLNKLCFDGLKDDMEKTRIQPLVERLNYELGVIKSMGYVDYFLIVWDFIHFAKSNGIMVGPGRGSAAGSIVAYTLCDHQYRSDPVSAAVRAFSESGTCPCPISTWTSALKEGRKSLIMLCVNTGKDRVVQIVTFGTLQARGVLRDGKSYGSSVCFCGFNCKDDSERTEYYTG